MSRRRAIVLAIVQIVMIIHIAQWLMFGTTLSPIEPSESIETVSHGLVNAGAVFFAIALLATLVLGRWVCGWGCHIVMLQDLCSHLMKRCGIRPRAFRSRLLIYVPLIIALYMFVWPLIMRFVILPLRAEPAHWPGFSTEFITTQFWETFPGVLVAIPFLLICGFATVYFLGAKGFCTYGCPYGGFFAPLDQLAVGRIRVNDDCEQCGHCTSVCTSNVRVHEEVRDYGMVVNPGCMKCMDCVSVCPNDALSFGLGKPAIGVGPRTKAPARPLYDLTWPEEIGCAIAFAIIFFVVRGAYGIIPLLMAVGIAGCSTFMAFKSWQLIRTSDVSLHRFKFMNNARLTGTGWAWSIGASLLFALLVHTALVRYHIRRGASLVPVSTDAIFAGQYKPDSETRKQIGMALGHLKKADALSHGGIGLLADPDGLFAQARMFLAVGDAAQCEKQLARALQIVKPTDITVRDFGRVLVLNNKPEEAVRYYSKMLEAHPDFHLTRGRLIALLTLLGRDDEAAPWQLPSPSDDTDQ